MLSRYANFCNIPLSGPTGICRYCIHKRCNGIRGKLKEDSKFKCQTYANLADIAEDCPATELNTQSLETMEKFCYLGGT